MSAYDNVEDNFDAYIYNSEIESEINNACLHPFEIRDFNNQEKQYIISYMPFREKLLAWFESTNSDGSWTEENVEFLYSLSVDIN
jgi:hypothetical protein